MSLISICIPTYNGEKYLQEALNSVKLQTYKNFEVIISDDESIDRTLEICQKFKNEVDFPVFIYSHSPAGIGANWNNCIGKANGEYIKFLFQDDILKENCIEEMVLQLKLSELKICICKRNILYKGTNLDIDNWIKTFGDLQKSLDSIKGNIITKKVFGDKNFLTPPYNKIGEPITGLIHVDVFKNIGLFHLQFKQFLDYEFWYRALLLYDFLLIDSPLVYFRFHELQTTNINKKQNTNETQVYFDFVKNNLKNYLHPEVRRKNFPTFFERIIRKIKTLT